MNRMLAAITLCAAVLLSGCEIIVTGGTPSVDGVRISNATVRTDTRAEIDGVERSVICDDRITDLTYGFSFEGPLERWTSYLAGVLSGDVIGYETFQPTDTGVQWESNRVTVTYAIYPGIAPLESSPESVPTNHIQLEAIRVVPVPQVLGYTRLYLEVGASPDTIRLSSGEIPVLADCNL